MREFIAIDMKDFKSIVGILEKNKVLRLYSKNPFGNAVTFSDEKSNVYLYIKKNFSDLIISNVSLSEKRKGTMTEILKELKKIAKKYKCNNIKVESVLSKEMAAFCIKEKLIYDSVFGDFGESIFGDYKYVVCKVK